MKTKPVRIQRKRTKGYSMQEHSRSINGLDCVYVGRTGKGVGKFGNPYVIDTTAHGFYLIKDSRTGERCSAYTDEKYIAHSWAVTNYDYYLRPIPDYSELEGKNLSCFCSMEFPCHVDVILKRLADEN